MHPVHSTRAADPYWLDQNYDYDAAGNADSEASREYVSSTGSNKFWSTRSYYGADEKLRVFNRFAGLGPNSDGSDRAHLGVYEEYWYDALGRRIQVRSRRDAGCNTTWPECPSVVNRFVWDGDQVLMERRVTGSDSDVSWLDWGTPSTVAYAHMGGIDAPVAAFKDGVMVVPHANWRGEFVTGHAAIGTMPVINWPGQYEALDGMPSNPPHYEWFGDMLTGYTDGSGQKYMRNRYYDPVKGTFTQKDPIGLAGGLNLYGYAGGDAVNFSDPFGLCTPWPACANGYWEGVAIAGHQRGGFAGTAKAVGASVMGAVIEGFGINQADRGMGEVAAGRTSKGLLIVGMAAAENLPGGKAVGKVDDIIEGLKALKAKVKPHPTRTGQGAAIDFGDGTVLDVRVETHGGLHGNVERFENGKQISNTHVRPPNS